MNTKLATTLIIGALLAPVAGYAAETTTEAVKETVADSVITTKIKAAYAKDKTVDMLDISVETDEKGVVTLSGTAKSKAQITQAVKLAKTTKGVTKVKNNLVVAGNGGSKKTTTENAKEHVSDSVITTKIKGEYAKDKTVSMMKISVDTDDKGAVALSGKAKSQAESDQAVKIARDTKGVTSVRNNITVESK